MLALMKVANSEEDEKSEQLQKQLINKEIDLEEFLTKMFKLRKSCHARRIKIEKLGELEQHSAGMGSSSSSHRRGYPAL